ncbi:MAG: hypothetical protein RLZZ237_958 [Pseudomonadota bacterium]|jgi:hypothetical protein
MCDNFEGLQADGPSLYDEVSIDPHIVKEKRKIYRLIIEKIEC